MQRAILLVLLVYLVDGTFFRDETSSRRVTKMEAEEVMVNEVDNDLLLTPSLRTADTDALVKEGSGDGDDNKGRRDTRGKEEDDTRTKNKEDKRDATKNEGKIKTSDKRRGNEDESVDEGKRTTIKRKHKKTENADKRKDNGRNGKKSTWPSRRNIKENGPGKVRNQETRKRNKEVTREKEEERDKSKNKKIEKQSKTTRKNEEMKPVKNEGEMEKLEKKGRDNKTKNEEKENELKKKGVGEKREQKDKKIGKENQIMKKRNENKPKKTIKLKKSKKERVDKKSTINKKNNQSKKLSKGKKTLREKVNEKEHKKTGKSNKSKKNKSKQEIIKDGKSKKANKGLKSKKKQKNKITYKKRKQHEKKGRKKKKKEGGNKEREKTTHTSEGNRKQGLDNKLTYGNIKYLDVCEASYTLGYGETVVVFTSNTRDKQKCKATLKGPADTTITFTCPQFNLNELGCAKEKIVLTGVTKTKKKLTHCMRDAPQDMDLNTNFLKMTYSRKALKKKHCSGGFVCVAKTVGGTDPSSLTTPSSAINPIDTSVDVTNTTSTGDNSVMPPLGPDAVNSVEQQETQSLVCDACPLLAAAPANNCTLVNATCCKYWLCGDLPRNCSSKNGTVYQIDDQWKEEENCKTCRCLFSSIEGAYTKCWDTFCPGKSHKDCLTLQKPLGQCCPQYFCDNTTCLSQGLYYGIGETWETYVAPCGECECQSVGNGQPEALCQLEVCPTPPSDPLCRPIKHNRCCDLQWECTNEYLITTPDKWVAGGRASVCVFTVLNQETMVDLFISLSTKTSSNTSSVLLNTTVEGPGHVCTTLDVPNVSEYYGDLEIFGKVGAAMVSESLMVKLEEMGKTFVQTDKFLYMPGQVVKFRILTIVGAESKVSYEDLEEVWVTSPSGVRLAHWLKVNNSQGLVHLEFPLADEVEEGKYKIQTRTEVGKGYQVFEVEHYDLPRFEVTLSPPPYVLSSDQYIIFTICAEYNWGQEVEGSAWLVVHTHTHYYNGHLEDQHPLVNTTVQSFTGCVAVNVSTNNLTEEMYFHTLNVEAVVTEQGTGVTYEAFTEVKIHRQVVTFKMIKSERYFKPGLPFVFQVEARYAGEMLARGEPVLVCVADICNNYTTNNNGSVTSILPPHLIHQDTPAYVQVGAVDHQGGPGILGDLQPSESTFYIKTYYSPSCSSMALHLPSGRLECQPGQNIKVLIPVIFVTNNTDKVAVTTQVISRGQVIMTSIQERVLTASPLGLDEDLLLAPLKDPEGELVRGSFTIEVTLPPTASPTVYIIIWYSRTDGEVVSASGTIDVALCLTNPTTLTWHSSSSNGTNPPAPGDKTSFTLSANPNSICGLGVVDRSVEMLAREQPHQLSVHTLLDVVRGMEVQSWEHYDYLDLYSRCYQDYNYDYWDYDYPLPPIRKRRSATGMEDSYAVHYVDAFYAFRDAGLLVVTDLDLETRPCPHHVPDLFLPGIMPLDDMAVMAPVASPGESSEEEEDEQEEEGDEQEEEGDEQEEEGDTEEEEVRNGQDTRSYFPETWLWQLLVLDNTGETVEEVTLPDTVTEWVGKAVCVHPQNGVGFSGPASIITFTPFFLDLIAPPSARRGEQVPLLVSVFNYLNQSLPVTVTLAESSRYNASWYTREVCVGPGTQGLLQFTVTPSYAGDISLTFSANITWGAGDTCGNGTLVISTRDTITEVLRVTLEGVIKEEVHSSFICAGEGNVTFEMKEVAGVVNDSDRSFVGVSGDLLGPTLENLGHLVRLPSGCGEQNMLNFAPNVYILQYLNISNQTTPQLIIKATDYMSKGYQRELRYRREEGSYSAFGEQDQEGSTWLTSFVLKSFAGAKNFIMVDEEDLAVSVKWLLSQQDDNTGCFKSVGKVIHKDMMGGVSSGSDGFLGCLTAYVVIALTETGHHNSPSAVSNALQCILNDATPHNYYSGAIKAYALALTSSADVESYIALAYALLQKEPKDVSKGSQVEAAGYLMLAMMKVDSVRYANEGFLLAKTITAHRNGQGGFVNTQDTVVALEALAAFNQVYPPSDTNLQVTVTAGNQSTAFNITQENRLLLQTQHITEPLPYNVSVTPSGVGCVVMMAVHRYNIPEEPKSEAFSMNFTATQVSCSSSALRVCFAYLLQDNSSNMAVLELHLQTGYLALEKDLELLLEKEIIKRFDIEEAIVQLYLESVSRDETCVELEVLQKTVLEDPHPGTLTLYDYYEPHLRLTKKFTLEKNGC